MVSSLHRWNDTRIFLKEAASLARAGYDCDHEGSDDRGGLIPARGDWRVAALSLLLALFVIRVIAQLVQRFWPTPLLPPFEAWHSATLPYPVLVGSQVVIILLVAHQIAQISRRRVKSRRCVGATLLALGAIYMTGAVFRLLAGMTFLAHLPFFNAPLPSLLHMVLAGIVLTLGDFNFRGAIDKAAARA